MPSRREFLHLSGGALLAQTSVRSAQVLFAQDAPGRDPAAPPLLVGIITEPTATHMNFYLRALASSDAVSGIMLADETGQSFALEADPLKSARSPVATFKDMREMLQKSPGLVVVSLEGHKMAKAIGAALEAGCHVLAEKPPCTRLDEFEALCRLANQKQRLLMLGMSTRLHPAAVQARKLIEDGYLGRVCSVTMNWVSEGSRLRSADYQRSWLADKSKAGGGKLMFHGIHYVDLIHYLTDDVITRVCGFAETVSGQPIGVEDCAVLALKFKNGMVGTLNTGFYLTDGYDTSVRIWGTEGWVRIELPSPMPLQWKSTKGPTAEVQRVAMESEPDDYGFMVRNAVNACRGVGSPFMDTIDSLNVMRVIFGAYDFIGKDLAGKGA